MDVWFPVDPNIVASDWPDPLETLLELESERREPVESVAQVSDAERAEFERALNLLPVVDKVLLDLQARGLGQHEIASRIGIAQPSVCYRLGHVRRWLGLVVPPRARARGHTPPEWVEPHVAQAFDQVIWCHKSHSATGRPQATVRGQLHRLLERLPPGPLHEMLRVALGQPLAWRAPRPCGGLARNVRTELRRPDPDVGR